MEITVAHDRIFVLTDVLTEEEAEHLAANCKQNAFGALHKVTNLLNRPREEDFELSYKEHRYQPFWHITATSNYSYDRQSEYQWPVSGPEVTGLTLASKEYPITKGNVFMSVLEHCKQEENQEIFVDAVSSLRDSTLKSYLSFSARLSEIADVQKLSHENIVIPLKVRASALVREVAGKMIHSIEADQIFEESVNFQAVDLYYRPVFAFKYRWISKDKEAVIEVDALTKKISFSQDSFPQLVGKVLAPDFLLDIGQDAAGIFIPGGSIAVKVAKRYMDVSKGKKP